MNGALSTHQWPTKTIADPPFSPIGDVRYWRMRTFHRGKPRSRVTTQNGPRACFGLGTEIKILATGRLVESERFRCVRGANC
jgi:hypothetical protein